MRGALRSGCEKSTLAPGRFAGVAGRKGAPSQAAGVGATAAGQWHAVMTQSTWHSDACCAVVDKNRWTEQFPTGFEHGDKLQGDQTPRPILVLSLLEEEMIAEVTLCRTSRF